MKIFVGNVWEGSPLLGQLDQIGDVVPVTVGLVNKNDYNILISLVNEAFSTLEPDDFIIMNGPASLQIVMTLIALKKVGHLNLLVFRKGKYYPLKLVFHNDALVVNKK